MTSKILLCRTGPLTCPWRICLFLACLATPISAFSSTPKSHVVTIPKQPTSPLAVPGVSSSSSLPATPRFVDNSTSSTVSTVHTPSKEEEDVDATIQSTKTRRLLPGIASVTLITLAVASKLGILLGPPIGSSAGEFGPYTNAMILQDIGAAMFTGTLGYIFVKGNTWLAFKGYLDPKDSRKIIHTLSAPLFMALWPIFSPAEGARFFAASVSFINAIRLYLAGSGSDTSLAYAVSRSGDQKEALGGPFLYVIILMFSILFFWRDGPVGIIALSAMAAGDGLADLVGRRYGKNNKWWFNPDKSIAGSAAFFVGATLCASLLMKIMAITLVPALPFSPQLLLGGIMLAAALIELIPGGLDDNWVVPLSAAILASVAFQ